MYSIKESDFEEAFNGLQRDSKVTSAAASRRSSMNFYHDDELVKIEKERAIREDLNSQDGNTKELHDQVRWICGIFFPRFQHF